ncbi:uncharacterized protein LOC113229899 [Hyposmocoma kahamanoa]|uniref:uncharacterized protein LOC113229899 n=1 Tax=Hyposmocoma kahamanoa TaxID=1477025 RepID=UPI000E6DA461|nr:uncharacterized protein LOC113229899 [Hyposmocoma kahamanoa]
MRSSALVLLCVVICVAYASCNESSSSIRERRQVDFLSSPHLTDLIKALVEAMKKTTANAGAVLKKLSEFDAVLNVMKKKTDAVLGGVKYGYESVSTQVKVNSVAVELHTVLHKLIQ